MGIEFVISTLNWQMIVLAGLALSIGWGIRGNFGHEYGAAIPGALAAMAVVLASGRPDWWRHIHYFAMFGALGWSFGGSMSYMMVVGFTHSGHPPSVLYGFANLFVLGFMWAFLGGAGTAIPALVHGDQLELFFVPITAVITGWALQSVVLDWYRNSLREGPRRSLNWYDTDWLAAIVATIAGALVAIHRGEFDIATSLVLHLSIGWFAAFLILVNVLKLRMNPPRGDNWSGCVGMVLGLLLFCWRNDLSGVIFVALLTGILGGIGFGFGQLLKILHWRTGLVTNWHSVMEQTHGLFHGIALAVAMGVLAHTSPEIVSSPCPSFGIFAVAFVLIGITYLNQKRCERRWLSNVETLKERMYGLHIAGRFWLSRGFIGWTELIYGTLGTVAIFLMYHQLQQPLAFLPESWLGKGQLYLLVFAWWMVVMNFSQEIVGFYPARLVTDVLLVFNAAILTLLLAILPQTVAPVGLPASLAISYGDLSVSIVTVSLFLVPLFVFSEWGITFLAWGRKLIPFRYVHIRFGPNATTEREIPQEEWMGKPI
jgi:hypothetical protein